MCYKEKRYGDGHLLRILCPLLLTSFQVEDDMILTLNHILNYQEESELLDNRM